MTISRNAIVPNPTLARSNLFNSMKEGLTPAALLPVVLEETAVNGSSFVVVGDENLVVGRDSVVVGVSSSGVVVIGSGTTVVVLCSACVVV